MLEVLEFLPLLTKTFMTFCTIYRVSTKNEMLEFLGALHKKFNCDLPTLVPKFHQNVVNQFNESVCSISFYSSLYSRGPTPLANPNDQYFFQDPSSFIYLRQKFTCIDHFNKVGEYFLPSRAFLVKSKKRLQ